MTVDLHELRRSPLHDLASTFAAAEGVGERAVRIRELPFRAMIGVRAEPGSDACAQAGDALGLQLPLSVGMTATSTGGDGQEVRTALWLGPDEWLVDSAEDPSSLLAEVEQALPDRSARLVDLSANRTTVELSGPSARRVLEKGCPVDLHRSAFGPGSAVSTNLAHVPVVLWQTGDQTYRLLARSSYAAYLGRWLLDAAREFAGPEIA